MTVTDSFGRFAIYAFMIFLLLPIRLNSADMGSSRMSSLNKCFLNCKNLTFSSGHFGGNLNSTVDFGKIGIGGGRLLSIVPWLLS